MKTPELVRIESEDVIRITFNAIMGTKQRGAGVEARLRCLLSVLRPFQALIHLGEHRK